MWLGRTQVKGVIEQEEYRIVNCSMRTSGSGTKPDETTLMRGISGVSQ